VPQKYAERINEYWRGKFSAIPWVWLFRNIDLEAGYYLPYLLEDGSLIQIAKKSDESKQCPSPEITHVFRENGIIDSNIKDSLYPLYLVPLNRYLKETLRPDDYAWLNADETVNPNRDSFLGTKISQLAIQWIRDGKFDLKTLWSIEAAPCVSMSATFAFPQLE
jgi:hypothetical protein